MMWLFALVAGTILLLAGLGFLCSGLISLVAFGALPFALNGTFPGTDQAPAAITGLVGAGFSAIFVLAGLVMTGGGAVLVYVGVRSRRKQKAQTEHIMTYGVEAEATITFLDRNFGVLVNNRPIYSIIEYTFQDRMERQHTGRANNVPSDHVIRSGLAVGGMVRIKYLPEEPSKSMVLVD